MAERKDDETRVTQDPAPVGATNPADAKVKGANLAHEDDKVRGGRPDGPILTSEPDEEAAKSSYPGPMAVDPHHPPLRTPRTDTPIVVAIASGAGEHRPPDPEKYHADGRPRD